MLNVDESRGTIESFLDRLDEESYSAMFRVMSPRLFRYFRLRGCSRDMAEDLTQEVMFTVYQRVQDLRNRDVFRPWLFQIARNAWLQYRRQEHRRVETAGLDALDAAASSCNVDLVAASCVGEWLEWLKPEDRELVILRYIEGFEYHELATILNMPVGTVQWKVFQLKRTLVGRLGNPRT